MAKNSTISTDLFVPKMTLTLTFSGGQEIVVDANKLRPEIRDMAILHGLKQKLVDAAAISRNIDNGQPASVADKYAAVKKVADRLMSADGQWNEGRGAAGESTPKSGDMLVRALIIMTGRDEEYVKDFLSAKTKEQRAALKKNPRVVAIIAELMAATVSNGVNTDELLGELGIDGEGDPDAGNGAALIDAPAKKPNTRTSKKKLSPAPVEE